MQPNYEVAEFLELTTPNQLKALGDAFRQKIVHLLAERAMTTQQLATMLDTPISTVAHHLKVLTDTEITKVVWTRKVRALTERYYGCTARNYISISSTPHGHKTATIDILYQALKNIVAEPEENFFLASTLGHARIPLAQIRAFVERVERLSKEFEVFDTSEGIDCGFLTAIYYVNILEPSKRKQEKLKD